ncbi:MAG: DUF4870 domain-containing protein [Planctomycetaceae bacterium]|nr:DUF4870 domain-containing protein [Planctomycetaceae bacterium]
MKTNTYCMLLHLSQLLIFPLLGVGLVVPVLLWAINKDKEPLVDRHGKNVVNWLISDAIYASVGTILFFVWGGTLTIEALAFVSIVFPIIGGIKAKDGIVWEYPLTIRFFK